MKPSSENLITVSLQISLEIIQILGWLIWVSMAKRKYMELLKGVLCLQTHSCGNIMSHGGQVPLMSTELTNWVGLLFFFFFTWWGIHICMLVNLVSQSCLNLCGPMDYSMPGFPVHHQLPEFSQTHVHRDSDAIQPSHPLSSPSPPAFNLSQHQGLV